MRVGENSHNMTDSDLSQGHSGPFFHAFQISDMASPVHLEFANTDRGPKMGECAFLQMLLRSDLIGFLNRNNTVFRRSSSGHRTSVGKVCDGQLSILSINAVLRIG